MCHIIAAAIHLDIYNRLRGSVLARTLKKEVGDLKNFFKEVGLTIEACKNAKTNEPDIMVYLTTPGSKKQHLEKVAANRERAKSE